MSAREQNPQFFPDWRWKRVDDPLADQPLVDGAVAAELSLQFHPLAKTGIELAHRRSLPRDQPVAGAGDLRGGNRRTGLDHEIGGAVIGQGPGQRGLLALGRVKPPLGRADQRRGIAARAHAALLDFDRAALARFDQRLGAGEGEIDRPARSGIGQRGVEFAGELERDIVLDRGRSGDHRRHALGEQLLDVPLGGAAVEEHQLQIGQRTEQLRQTLAMRGGIAAPCSLQIEHRTVGMAAVMQHRQIIAVVADQIEQPRDVGRGLGLELDDPGVVFLLQRVADRVAFPLQAVEKPALVIGERRQNDRRSGHQCQATVLSAACPAGLEK